ncbi:MAG: autoinducer binding domain-containing protein [Rhodobacter sp.]|nr:autoinducer binding domain-containing protein [Rhodobacter sp.]
MDNRTSIATLLADIDQLTPGGFAIGLHISFSGPTFLFQTFPQDWVDYYAKEGLQLRDPAMHWSFANSGSIRWRDLTDDDPADVIGKAREHGLPYGMTISLLDQQSRTVGGFAHPERDYLDVEIDQIKAHLLDLHRATIGVSVLSADDMAALKRMSIRLSHS